MPSPFAPSDVAAVPIWPVSAAESDALLARRPEAVRRWAQANRFTGQEGKVLPVPGPDGALAGVLFGLGDWADPFVFGSLPRALPPGIYRLDATLSAQTAAQAALGWALGSYGFTRYRRQEDQAQAQLALPAGLTAAEIERVSAGVFLTRDLINTPANEMGPAELAEAAAALARRHGAACTMVEGEALAAAFPMIHAVGQGSARAPRLIDFVFGPGDAPKVTLVGKGVCFDSGGLDLKPATAMALMKKDMGGAANALGLAQMIMDADLPVRLRVLIPAVENSVSGTAFRPGDVLRSRKGLSVEIGNTDAEGRLVLADALALADAERPDLLVDLATLTGAARVALGPDLPALFSDDEALAAELAGHAAGEADPLWRLPLWPGYAKELDSRIADLNNISGGTFAGAITAALFLRRFVTETVAWAHLDLYAWNQKARPGRPIGGEAQTIRALFALIRARYGG